MTPAPPREVAVLGLARTGVAAARWLASQGMRVYASDVAMTGELIRNAVELGAIERVETHVGGHDIERISQADFIVVSPGVPPEVEVLQVARDAGVPVYAELELAARALPDTRLAVITGTNGKTTTTMLVHDMVRAAGIDAVAAGNVGRPLIDVVLSEESPQWAIIEASSFQLHDCYELAPAIGVVTNFSPDHLDRYPSVEAYFADKRRLFQNANEESTWILPDGDATVDRMAEGAEGHRKSFGISGSGRANYDKRSGHLLLDGQELIARDEFPLLGDHNVLNALAASLVAETIGLDAATIGRVLRDAEPLPHRLEVVGEFGGKVWVNDSKATNVQSARVAIQAMDRPFALILGGRDKGEPYSKLAGAIGSSRCRAIIAYGEAAALVAGDLDDVVEVASLADAVDHARKSNCEVVLLSPACSSFDQFRDYEERGDSFKSLVASL